ncbi:conserved hypothetical protein [Tenacibaculum sp. 190524A02b]|uniref:Lipoprotein n=1 Tax=Tenacibaculum vairaonense TaxID=3137860 RepID=A0ABP1FB87_9FLAO
MRILILILSFIVITSCKTDKKAEKAPSKKIEPSTSISTNELVLKENSFGKLNLKKGMTIEESVIKKAFNNLKVSKSIGTQDGPDYYIYKIGDKIALTTVSTQSNVLSEVLIDKESKLSDQYGVKIGMPYKDVKNKRSNMSVITEHYHIYLYEKKSNIIYEMSLGNYNGPDKEEYSIEDIENSNSKVIRIIWR